MFSGFMFDERDRDRLHVEDGTILTGLEQLCQRMCSTNSLLTTLPR